MGHVRPGLIRSGDESVDRLWTIRASAKSFSFAFALWGGMALPNAVHQRTVAQSARWNVGLRGREGQTACKPGSVPDAAFRPLQGAAIPLGRASQRASRDQPGRRGGNTPASRTLILKEPFAGRPYSVLLLVGFTLPPPLPGARCALAAPFHPCSQPDRPGAGGLFSVALSLGSPPPAVGRHHVPVEPGLSSIARAVVARTTAAARPSDGRSNAPLAGCRQSAALALSGGAVVGLPGPARMIQRTLISPDTQGICSRGWVAPRTGSKARTCGTRR